MKLCAEKNHGSKGLRGFFGNNLYVILAFLIPAAIMGAAFVFKRFFPFGNGMILVVDSWHQYYPFLCEYQQMLKEGSSLMYSWNTGGGSSFLGVIANYLASPLYLLSALVPSGTPWLQVFLALTVVLRIGCAGMFFAIFLRKVFGRNDLSLLMFSPMYALCAFVQGYYWNMMWLDTMALLPLVIAGVVGVLRDKKFGLYIVSLALSVMFSFYIGYMVCLFVLIVSICYTLVSFVNFKESFKNAGKMLGYTVVAFMITAVITIPAFLNLSASDSASDASSFPLEYTINQGYGYDSDSLGNTLLAIVRTATNMMAYTKPIKLDQGLPNIACGVLSLVLLFFYFTTNRIKLKEKLVSGGLCVFFLLSFVVNQLNYIWHGLNTPAMVYFRWSFIFSFAVITLAYRAFTLIDGFTKKTFAVTAVLLVLYLGGAFVFQKKVSVALTFAGAVAVVAGFALYRKGKLNYKVLSVLLCILTVGEMGLNTIMGVRTVGRSKLTDYPQNHAEVSELLEVAGANKKDEMFRTEFSQAFTLNDGALYSEFGITTFNSMVDSSYADVLKDLGLAASKGNNRYEYMEGTPVENMFLNIKYLITRNGQKLYDHKNMEIVAATDECGLYENRYYVPMGFMVEDDLLTAYSADEGWDFPGYIQNLWFSSATGIKEDVLTEIDPVTEVQGEYTDRFTPNDSTTHYYKYELKDLEKPESTQDEAEADKDNSTPLWVEYEIKEDGCYYGTFKTTTVEKATVIINEDEENAHKLDQDYTNLTAVGVLRKGDRVRVELEAEYKKTSNVIYKLVKLEEDVMAKGVEKLRQNTMTLEEWTDRGLKGSVKADESGLFYTSVLYTEGWKAYVDGKEVEITPVADTFVAFELPQGEHTVELRFTTPGLYAGLAVSLAGIVIFALLCLVSSKNRRKAEADHRDDFAAAGTGSELTEENCTDTE
ncbi:MAG: YfhO family protein [Ruminococcus sp.]|nr:YfhO family protein [Ruminococcus sp.]